MDITWVDIYNKLVSASIEEEQKLNVPVVNYVSPRSKTKPEQSRMNKVHNSRYLLRALWKLDYLGPI